MKRFFRRRTERIEPQFNFQPLSDSNKEPQIMDKRPRVHRTAIEDDMIIHLHQRVMAVERKCDETADQLSFLLTRFGIPEA